MDVMMDRIFICEQRYYATKKLISNPASFIIPSGNETLHCDVILWNEQHITAAGLLVSLFIVMDTNVKTLVSFFIHLRGKLMSASCSFNC